MAHSTWILFLPNAIEQTSRVAMEARAAIERQIQYHDSGAEIDRAFDILHVPQRTQRAPVTMRHRLAALPPPAMHGGPGRHAYGGNAHPPAGRDQGSAIPSNGEEEGDGTMDLDDEIDYISDDDVWDDPRAAVRRKPSPVSRERTRRELMDPSERAAYDRLSRELFGEEDEAAAGSVSDIDAGEVVQERTNRDLMARSDCAIHDRLRRELFSEEDDATGPDSDIDTAEAAEAAALLREAHSPLLPGIDRQPRAGIPDDRASNSSADRVLNADRELRELRASLRRRNRASRPTHSVRSRAEAEDNDDDMLSEAEPHSGTVAHLVRPARPARPVRLTPRIPRRRAGAEAIPISHATRLARSEQVHAAANRRHMWQGQQFEG
jgi:hypothetical protein